MKIFIGGDHVCYHFKNKIIKYLTELDSNYEVEDKGPFIFDKDDDYPDFVREVALSVAKDPENSRGIIFGGSGQGEAMCANRVNGIRTALFYGPKEPVGEINAEGQKSADSFEIIKLARQHNNANILSIGLRFVSEDEAKFAIELFLKTPFSNIERHQRRINKLDL